MSSGRADCGHSWVIQLLARPMVSSPPAPHPSPWSPGITVTPKGSLKSAPSPTVPWVVSTRFHLHPQRDLPAGGLARCPASLQSK